MMVRGLQTGHLGHPAHSAASKGVTCLTLSRGCPAFQSRGLLLQMNKNQSSRVTAHSWQLLRLHGVLRRLLLHSQCLLRMQLQLRHKGHHC